MEAIKLAKLARIQNYRTRYEIAASRGQERVLVGYSARKGRRGLLDMARRNAAEFVEFFQVDGLDWKNRASDGASCGEWAVNFSGRTQREAIISGELDFFVRLLAQRKAPPPDLSCVVLKTV